jgi:glutaredoxin
MARFKKEGIEYIFYDVDADPAKNREMWSLIKGSTSVSLPVIKVNDKAFPGGLRDIEEIIRLCK